MEAPRKGAVLRREPSVAEKFAARDALRANHAHAVETFHRIYHGDARKMSGLSQRDAIHLVVTSPPYWDLKRYEGEANGDQLGHIGDEKQFLGELSKVWRRCFKALTPGGRMCVVVGDVCRSRKLHGRHRVEPLHAQILLQCKRIGFDPLAPIFWNKISNVATEVQGNGAVFLGKPYEPNAIVKNDVEYILLFRKPGGYRHPTPLQRTLSLIDPDDHRRWFQQVWSDVRGEVQRSHPAPFPVEIARRLIGMFSFVGDTVLDPFCGLGTTTAAAIEMQRSSIGFEIERRYFTEARKRFEQKQFEGNVEFYSSDGPSQ